MTVCLSHQFKKTKIVCTIGPACSSKEILVSMIEMGMNVARLNASHGDHKTLANWIKNIRAAEKMTDTPIAIMLDLQGPKIRVGQMKDGKPIVLKVGQNLTITTEETFGTSSLISTSYKRLPEVVEAKQYIFLNDGMIRLKVLDKNKKEIFVVVETGGILTNYKGINVPGGKFKGSPLTPKDRKDIRFAKDNDIDIVAISFVEKATDVKQVKKFFESCSPKKHPLIIAKIERPSALKNLDKIISTSDGVMIARGDLGVEIKLEKVPLKQKEIIRLALEKKRFTIVATQMLESMTHSPRPTRAEVSDVANSILDNTDGIMLSAETAMGDYPIDAVKLMSRISLEIEKFGFDSPHAIGYRRRKGIISSITDGVTWSAVEAAENLEIPKIIVFTESGKTALSLSLKRPKQQIYAFTPDKNALRKMQVYNGVFAILCKKTNSFENLIQIMERMGKEKGFFKKGETVLVVAGPPGVSGQTNQLKVHKIGEASNIL